jgi:energy-coupling factor transporter transmembrane protein EcfT
MHPSFFAIHDLHPYLLLMGLALFPRVTMLFVGGPFSALAWAGWFFCPHVVVAIFATTEYWNTNPVLCVIAWMFAFAGTSGEARTTQGAQRRVRIRVKRK